MKWTKDRPTEPGWYWQMGLVGFSCGKKRVIAPRIIRWPDDRPYEWNGDSYSYSDRPIPEPKEADDA